MAIGFIESSGNKNFNRNPHQPRVNKKFIVLPIVNQNQIVEMQVKILSNNNNLMPIKKTQPFRTVNIPLILIQFPNEININDSVILDAIIDLYNN